MAGTCIAAGTGISAAAATAETATSPHTFDSLRSRVSKAMPAPTGATVLAQVAAMVWGGSIA